MTDLMSHKPATPPMPANESERLAALHRYKILDTPPEAAFDRITALAARLFDSPIALISLVDESRAWFKSCIGFGAREVSRNDTLCSFAVLADEPLIIPDARLDDRFACNPFVQSEPGVRFYAGAPLLSRDGFNLGTLCLLDSQPRTKLSAAQQATLVDLAAMVVDALELRLAAHKIAQLDTALIEITRGVATVIGDAYFDALVQQLANVLDVDYVYIGLIEGDDPTKRVRTIATCAHGQSVANLEYPLQETPCWEVIAQRKICCYPCNVQAVFPNAPLLKPLLVESYMAIPFFDSNGTALGLLGVMDGKPLEYVQLAESLLTIFALRIATELERQHAEAALRQSEARYRTLFESIDEGFCVVEVLLEADATPIDYRILEVNPVFEQQTGLQDAIGKTARQLNFEAHWIEIYGRVALTGEAIRFENGSETLDRWFDVYACRTGEPESRKVAIVFKDISDRKRAEAILQRAAELDAFRVSLSDALRPLVDPVEVQAMASRVLGEYLGANRVAYFEVRDADYVVERDYVNGAAALAGHYPIDSFGPKLLAAYRVGRTVSTFDVQADPNLSPEQRSAYSAIEIGAYIGIPLVKEGKFVAGLAIHTSGSRVWTPDEILLAEEVAGRTWAAVDRARAEAIIAADLQDTQRLRELGAQLVIEDDIQTLYQAILSTAIALTKADAGTVQIFDVATQDLVLLATQSFERTMTEHFYRVDASSHTPCGIALRKGIRTFVDFDVPESEDPSGSMRMHVEAGYLSGQSTPLTTRTGRPIGMVSTHWRERHRPSDRELRFLDLLARQASDLIEQRQTAADQEQLLVLEQAARTEADRANRIKDEFLAVLSHELRSPLNPILGWTRLLQNGKLDETRQREALDTIERNAKLQAQLIEDLLDISRIMQGKLSLTAAPVSLAHVIATALETVRLAAEAKHIQITLDLAPNIALLSGDPARLQQVVWNLLTNAVKFTPNGGQVTVELRQLEQAAQLRVIDTGKGIQPQFLPHVFEYFRQEDGSTTRRFGGLGLGLAIVRQIVEMHGGTVWAESEGENRGAIFTVQLPLSPQARLSEPEPPYDNVTTETPLSHLQILLVDDETDTREFQAMVLAQSGAIVTVVASGLEALQALDRFTPDLLISDVGMAEMDGYTLMEQIRHREALRSHSCSPDQGGTLPTFSNAVLPAIALTAYAGTFAQQKAIESGFQVHLTKPVEPEALVSAIVNLLRR